MSPQPRSAARFRLSSVSPSAALIALSLAVPASGAPPVAGEGNASGPDRDARELQELEPPIEASFGPLTHLVNRYRVIVFHGAGPADDEILPGGSYPLVTAIRNAGPGDVIGIDGEIPGNNLQLGGGDAGMKAYRADWGRVPIDLTIVGINRDRTDVIHTIYLHQGLSNGEPTGGVARLRIENLTIQASPGSTRCIGVPKGADTYGIVQVYDVDFVGATDGSFGGLGYRWGIRAQGRMQWDLRRVHAAAVEEHVLYIDSPMGPSYFVDCTMEGAGRTMVQIVNRKNDNPGPSGSGTLLFEGMRAYNVKGDGGSAFTIAGHLGGIVLRDCSVIEGPNGSQGAVAIWVDDSPEHGAHFDPDGYANGPVIIDGLFVFAPNADRNHVLITGSRGVHLHDFSIIGNRTAFEFRQQAWPNGYVRCHLPDPVSRYPGFGSPWKMQWAFGWLLSDEEIDALRWP